MTRVAVSILNFNSAQSTIACVDSLLVAEKAAGDRCQLEIFIADNASALEDQQELQQSLREKVAVHLKVNDENLGFSAGHNQNLQAIFSETNPDYVWLLNNDCLVSRDALSALLECAEQDKNVGIWGATLLEPDGETIQCAGGCFYNSWLSTYRQYGRGKPSGSAGRLRAVNYDYIAGASLFLPCITFQHGLVPLARPFVGDKGERPQCLNEDFFLYFEELDLAKRLKPGFEMAWCRNAFIVHAGGASTGSARNARAASAEYHSTLSALRFTRQYSPEKLWLMAPARFVLKSIQLVLKGKPRLLKPLTRAYRDFLLN